VIKKPRTRGGYSPARGLQNTNPQWVVAPVEKKMLSIIFIQSAGLITKGFGKVFITTKTSPSLS